MRNQLVKYEYLKIKTLNHYMFITNVSIYTFVYSIRIDRIEFTF